MKQNRHFLLAGFVFLLWVELFSLGRAVWNVQPEAFDFRQLYSAGAMVRAEDGARLYEANQLQTYEDRLVSPRDGVLPFNHPAYETLFYLPLTLLSYRSAYYAMTIVNLILLMGLVFALRPQIRALSEVWVWLPTMIFLGFLPFAVTVIQGQDSVLLTLCIALAGLALDRGREREAGLLLALGLFKFQFILPIALLLALWRKWKTVGWFAAGACLLGAMSLAITGPGATSEYFHSLNSMSSTLSKAAEDVYGIHPAVMPNLRGLCYPSTALTVLLSVLLLGWAATRKYSFDLAVLVAVLVSYHCLYHDLSVLAVPLIRILALRQRGMEAGMFLVPSMAYGFGLPFWLVSLPIFGLAVAQKGPAMPKEAFGRSEKASS